MIEQVVRGPLLVHKEAGGVVYYADGVLAADGRGVLCFVGAWQELVGKGCTPPAAAVRKSDGVMLPPLIDVHTHVPQHPIRGRFVEGVPPDAPGGRLLNGLKRNVFPAEAQCSRRERAQEVVNEFAADTLAHGVVGGAAYMTVSADATEVALATLGDAWSVGLVGMNQNCPEDLRTDEPNLEHDIQRLADRFGTRLIVTDRFAVAVNTVLRRRLAIAAGRHGLRTQTHLNEQTGEKRLIEGELYPEAASYTDVYRRDGLLDHRCIVAHCIHMRDDEWRMLADHGAVVAHCPTSNFALGSGVMSLERMMHHGLDWAIATDVGASPTVSLLAELGRFLRVHEGQTSRATAIEGLYRITLGAAKLLGLDGGLGRLEAGRPMSFIEVESRDLRGDSEGSDGGAEAVIRSLLPENLDQPTENVRRVTIAGSLKFKLARQGAAPKVETASNA
jgi:guanine deaminase